MKKLSAKVFYQLIVLLPLFTFFFLVKPTHAEAVSLYSKYSYYQRDTKNDFSIKNPAKDVTYSVWVDGEQYVQQKPLSKDGKDFSTSSINVGGALAAPKKICLTDEVISDKTGGIFMGKGNLCKWSVSIYVTQNTPPNQTEANDYLDSATKPTPKPPEIAAYISISQTNFKQNTKASVTIKNAQKGSQYYLWIDTEDPKPQVTTSKDLSGDLTKEVNVYAAKTRETGAQQKKICMNDIEYSFTENGGLFPTYYECRYFVYINVLANEPSNNGVEETSKDPKVPERPLGKDPVDKSTWLALRMDYTNYLHDAVAGYHITNPVAGAQYYIWVDGENKPQRTKKASSTDEINDTLNVGGSASSPKKICLNDVEFEFKSNGGYFPVGYECRLYVLVNVSKETPADQGPPVSSNDNPQGDVANNKLSPTPTPVPILPPCIEGVNSSGALVIIPTYAPDQSNKAAYETVMGQVSKCTKVDSAIGPINTDPAGFILKLFQIFLSISGGIALMIIIGAGYRYMMSQGNAEAIKAAQEQITSAIVGLLFLVFSMVLLQVIGVDILHLPGFSSTTQVAPGPNNIK